MQAKFPKPPYRIGADLAEELLAYLDREATGLLPTPEGAAKLLRRLREEMMRSITEDRHRHSLVPIEEEGHHPELYRAASPP